MEGYRSFAFQLLKFLLKLFVQLQIIHMPPSKFPLKNERERERETKYLKIVSNCCLDFHVKIIKRRQSFHLKMKLEKERGDLIFVVLFDNIKKDSKN